MNSSRLLTLILALLILATLTLPRINGQDIPLEATVYLNQTISLDLSSCHTCYIKAYLLPKNVKFKQNVLYNSIKILEGDCTYKIKLDNYSNPYLLFKCVNTNRLEFVIESKILRFYNLEPGSDVECYKNLNYYVGPTIFYVPEFRMALNKVSPKYCLANLYYYLKYISKNFQYSNKFSNTTLPPTSVLYNMQGNCDEIAWLIAEIARNFNIPAKYVLGIWLQRVSPTYHAWAEFWIRNGWYDVDILAKEYGYVDARHIYLAEFYSPVRPITVENASIASEFYMFSYKILPSNYLEPVSITGKVKVSKGKLWILGILSYRGFLPDTFTVSILLNSSNIYTTQITADPEENYSFNVSIPLEYLSYGTYNLKILAVEDLFGKIYAYTAKFTLYPEPDIVIERAYYKSSGDIISLDLKVRNKGKGEAKNVTVILLLSNYSGFECKFCVANLGTLNVNGSKVASFKVVSLLPLLPKQMLWPVKLEYMSLNNESYLYTFNIMILYLENPREKLIYLAIGLLIFSVIIWLMSKVKYSI